MIDKYELCISLKYFFKDILETLNTDIFWTMGQDLGNWGKIDHLGGSNVIKRPFKFARGKQKGQCQSDAMFRHLHCLLAGSEVGMRPQAKECR